MKAEIKGYKVTNPDLTCNGFQYELGKTYTHEGSIKICSRGFHFCELPDSCFNYYGFDPNNRVFEVVSSGEIQTEGDKSCASEITLVRELAWDEVLRIVNTGKDNTGRSNSGNRNSGDSNSGDRNSGDSNSGNWNSGYRNSGDSNPGNSNSGYRNSGNRNSGYRNSGNWNSGYSNSGNWNSGYRNSGDSNSGNRNSGDSNSGYRNSGAFCLDNNPKVFLFDLPTDMGVREWEDSKAFNIMANYLENTIWVNASIMTDEEKAKNPKYETTEGYLKTIPLKEAWANMWGNLSNDNKKVFLELPNFDAKKFGEITGIIEDFSYLK